MSNFLAHAQTIALTKLLIALESTDDPAEIRRLSQVILAINPERFTEVGEASPPTTQSKPAQQSVLTAPAPRLHATSQPASNTHPITPRPQPALTTTELAALQILLPHVKPERFLRKHTPDHWRAILANHAHAPPPSPSTTTRAA